MAGRPREFDRELALLKARDLFWQQGFEGTSMSDLVAKLGIASARIYKAFGSKELLFREAIEHYEANEGSFAERAFAENTNVHAAFKQMLNDAVALYSRNASPQGCMVVSSAVSVGEDNQSIRQWLMEHRQQRTQGIIARLQAAVQAGELPANTDAESLGDYFAAFLHGLSIQARDGVSRLRLEKAVALALTLLAHPHA